MTTTTKRATILDTPHPASDTKATYSSSVKRPALQEACKRGGHLHREKAPYPGYRYVLCTNPACGGRS